MLIEERANQRSLSRPGERACTREGGTNRAAYLYASMAAVLRLMCLLPIYGRWFKINVSIGPLYSSSFMFYATIRVYESMPPRCHQCHNAFLGAPTLNL